MGVKGNRMVKLIDKLMVAIVLVGSAFVTFTLVYVMLIGFSTTGPSDYLGG